MAVVLVSKEIDDTKLHTFGNSFIRLPSRAASAQVHVLTAGMLPLVSTCLGCAQFDPLLYPPADPCCDGSESHG